MSETQQIIKRLRQAVRICKEKEARGDWLDAADEREAIHKLLNELMEQLLHEDLELLLLEKEDATVLEWLARNSLDRQGDLVNQGDGYGKLREAIMNHDQWTFLS